MTVRDVVQAAAGQGGDNLYVEDVFSTYLYTGNGSTQTITNGIDLAGEGGLVWQKLRDTTTSHALIDTARGGSYYIESNSAFAQDPIGATTFNSNGYSLGSGNGRWNANEYTYVSWTFRKQPKFFDVVTYTGNDVAGRTVAHNLGSVPGCIIVKNITSSARSWEVFHTSLGPTKAMQLDLTTSATTSIDYWNNTSPTSTEFTVGINNTVNTGTHSYVAYLFAHNAGGFGDDGEQNVISCGSYTTDGSASAQHINLGFEPQWFIVKKATNNSNWEIYDNMRGWSAPNDTYGVSSASRLYTNLNVGEGATTSSPGPTATGMYFPDGGQSTNSTYIYIAIRRPMKKPESGTEVFSVNTTSPAVMTAGFPVDAVLFKYNVSNWSLLPRLTVGSLSTSTTSTEVNYSAYASFASNTAFLNNGAENPAAANWMFKRAPGFFDVVAYTGTGSATTFSHNLGVVPELMIVKERSPAGWWWNVYYGTANKFLKLNTTDAETTNTAVWNNTAPTSSVFSVGAYNPNNTSGSTYIAYLFASCPGVSKVGSYTGTGADLNVDCGFSAGARFILIKRTDPGSTGDWYVWDSARGIVAGNDPYLLLNSAAAENTSTDYIDPLASGFTVTSNASSTVNVDTGTYIFLAIA